MNRNQRAGMLSGLLVVACLGIATTAFAGAKALNEVWIGTYADGSKTVSGSLGGARNSSDTQQNLGCAMHNWAIWCYATDRSGISVTCSVPSAQFDSFAKVLATMNSDSNLQFTVQNGQCVNLFVWNDSRYMPKAP